MITEDYPRRQGMTVTEDYVSFEIVKLLKEKGFDTGVRYFYQKIGDDITYHIGDFRNWNAHGMWYSIPTLQMAMKWLREVHELYIEVSLSCDRENSNTKIFDASIFNLQNQRYKKLGNIQGYEAACEAAIKYCLENLI